jgi:hypothetical protein
MADSHVLPWNKTSLAFVLAGRATLTLEDVLTGQRFTYNVKQKVDKGYAPDPKHPGKQVYTIIKRHDFWFVSVQSGAVGASAAHYLGVIDPKGFRTTAKTKGQPGVTADTINVFGDMLRDLKAGLDRGHQLKIWHCGKCGRCGRTLTVPSSILTGIGPDCAADMGIEMVDATPTTIEKIGALDDPTPAQED